MTNVLQAGASWLGAQLKATAQRQVTVRQGAEVREDVTAWMSQHDYDVADESGFVTTIKSFDWGFVRTDLIEDGREIKIRQGAEIIETLDGLERKYEAMDIGDRDCVEWDDSSGILLKVHTKLVDDGSE